MATKPPTRMGTPKMIQKWSWNQQHEIDLKCDTRMWLPRASVQKITILSWYIEDMKPAGIWIMQLVRYLGWIFMQQRTKNKGNSAENSTRPVRIFKAARLGDPTPWPDWAFWLIQVPFPIPSPVESSICHLLPGRLNLLSFSCHLWCIAQALLLVDLIHGGHDL